MTEEQFRIECGKDTDPEIAQALVALFRSMGWHNSARLIQDMGFEAEHQNYEDEIEDAKAEGYIEGVEAGAKALENSELDEDFVKKGATLVRELVYL